MSVTSAQLLRRKITIVAGRAAKETAVLGYSLNDGKVVMQIKSNR